MQTVVVLALFIALSGVFSADAKSIDRSSDVDWEAWKLHYDKKYSNVAEDDNRRKIWETTLRDITHHNLKYSLGNKTYARGINQFSDLTSEEFATTFLRHYKRHKHHRRHHHHNSSSCNSPANTSDFQVPDSVDWRTKGYVTPVKQQGECLSSLYFSVTGALEGSWFKRTGILIPLSEQNIEDCAVGYLDLPTIYGYIEKNGLESLADYPDTGVPQSCMFDPKKQAAICSGYETLPAGDENQLKKAVASIGPISATINASPASFQQYTTGVYNDPTCTPDQLDFAVLIVGYGTDPTAGDYWIVKNSWGPNWGMGGYILMSRNKNNQCGIASYTSYPYYTC